MLHSAAALLCFCLVAVYSADGDASRKFKRDVSGLMSFPRIGRSDRLWNEGALFPEPREAKRQSLVSFPRTGKRDWNHAKYPENCADFRAGTRETDRKVWALVQIKDLPRLMDRPTEDAVVGEMGEASGENRD